MDEHRTSKPTLRAGRYLKYAIGEIILVVIGILIALQINNWNQDRLNRNKELDYLKEIKSSLKTDSVKIVEVLEFNTVKDSVVLNFMNLFKAGLSNEERLRIIENYATPFTSYGFFKPKATAWNNFLAAENINLIADKHLRKQLMDYYSFNYDGSVQERLKIMNRKVIDENFPKFFTYEYTLKTLNLETELPSNAEFDMHLNQTLLSDLFGIRYLIKMQNQFLMETKDQITTMIKLIDEQLIQYD